MKNRTKLPRSLITTGVLSLALFATAMPASAVPAPPGGANPTQGRACIAIRFAGAGGKGHVGWGVELRPGTFMFGAVEGKDGVPVIPERKPNGGWYNYGSWDDMLNAFRSPMGRPSNPLSAGHIYDAVKCTLVIGTRSSDAEQLGKTMRDRGYFLARNNCLDVANQVIALFGAKTPHPSLTIYPRIYYSQLVGPAWKEWSLSPSLGAAPPQAMVRRRW